MISEALRKTGRPIVLSLSPGPTPLEKADEVAKYAEMWRISDDFWDHWGVWPKHEWSQGLKAQFANTAKWSEHTKPGHWPDADMLPVGHLGPHPGEGEVRDTQFTKDEQRTLLTLWAMARSPLMIGGNLTQMDAWTLALLTNKEVLEVDQHSRENKAVKTTEEMAVWTAVPESGDGRYVAVFNLADKPQTFELSWSELGFTQAKRVRDLWGNRDSRAGKKLKVTLAPHASQLLRISE